MKKWTRLLSAGALCGALLVGGALAAEDTGIAVQLDGQNLSFTDAAPQVKDQRTFLPFRAVFEAMGAEVGNEGSVITATRDGKTLTMTLNETEATLTEGEKTTTITMDVAPYVDNETWRTYVPVRFAAQAFGCAVGWDQEKSTAIIVDTDKVVDAALEGKKFTYLEKLVDYSKKYNDGIWDMEAGFDGDLTMLGMPMKLDGTVKGTVADSEKMDMDMNMKMDLTEFVKSVNLLTTQMGGEPTELSAEDQATLDALKKEGIDLTMRGDLAKGTLYMNMKGQLLETAGMKAEDWYKLDMAALMKEAGMDWAELLATSKDVDYVALAKAAVASLPLTDSTAAYDKVKTAAESVVASLSDEGFEKEGNDYTALVELEENGVSVTVVLTMTMEKDAVTAYVMGMHMEATEDETTVAMDMTTGMDDKDQMTAEVNMDMAGLITVQLTMKGKYAQGKTAPVTEPPAGANVVDYMELLASEMSAEEAASLGVIGGADGPTSIFVTNP